MKALVTVIFSAAVGVSAALVYQHFCSDHRSETEKLLDQLTDRISEIEKRASELATR